MSKHIWSEQGSGPCVACGAPSGSGGGCGARHTPGGYAMGADREKPRAVHTTSRWPSDLAAGADGGRPDALW